MFSEQSMFNPKVIKKMKEDTEASKDLKSMSKHALKSMTPEMESEDEKEEESPKKGMGPEAKLEIEIMLQSAKKKKK